MQKQMVPRIRVYDLQSPNLVQCYVLNGHGLRVGVGYQPGGPSTGNIVSER